MYDVEATSSDGGKYNNTMYYPSPADVIPVSHYLKAVKYGKGNAWAMSQTSPAVIMFRTEGVTPKEFGEDNANIIYPNGKESNIVYACLKMPRSWVIDAVEVQTYGMATVNAYWKPSGQIFLWHIMGGTHYWTRRQTAYVYPDTYTTSRHIIAPFVSARRSLLTRGGKLWSAEAGVRTIMGSFSQVAAHAAVKYEMPFKGTPLRPAISLRYDIRQATDGDMKGMVRNTLTVTAAATF